MMPHVLLAAYWRARRKRFATRDALEDHQQARLRYFAHTTLRRSPWFRSHAGRPINEWPMMNKSIMMARFDEMNTAGLKLQNVLACARQAEASRDFSPRVGAYSVGLSSGTSGGRGVFVVSERERAVWAGTVLAKLLPRGLLSGERVALCLRADNNLYGAVRTPFLSFEFFDLLQPMSAHVARLAAFAPTILVGPAQALRHLAEVRRQGALRIAPALTLNAAEVMSTEDAIVLSETFGHVGQIYQATEGFLGATCEHGVLHLNESFVHIEPEWLDDQRFVPIVTDFTRTTQPIVRYRLDDILVARRQPCPCGSPERAIEHIEGRCDDALGLPGREVEYVTVFADTCSRVLAQCLPIAADYRLIQTSATDIALHGETELARLESCRQHLASAFERIGVDTARLKWHLSSTLPAEAPGAKRRRIARTWRFAP